MGRRIKTAAAVLAAALLGITGTYGYFSDTLKVTNHISLGDVNIGLQEFEKKGGIETPYQSPKTILPGEVLSKIPRITNYAMPCWVRARIFFENQNSEIEGLDDSMISGFTKNWVRRGEYYYYTEILKKKESVDLFQTVTVPSSWTEKHEGQKLGITVQAEAIQAANFQPDFSAMSPWGNQTIQKCVHEQDGTAVCQQEKTKLSVEFNGEAHRLMAVPGDFFSNIGTAMPGDVFEDSAEISNTTENEAELFFRTSVEGQDSRQKELLKGIRLTIYLNGKKVYRGTLDSPGLEKSHSLGVYQPEQKGSLKFVLEIPEKWDNAYALREADVQWIFTVNEREETEKSEEYRDTDSSFSDASVKDTEGKGVQSVKTGDESGTERMLFLFFASGAMAALVFIYKKRRRKP